jgi:hypothetical protein
MSSHIEVSVLLAKRLQHRCGLGFTLPTVTASHAAAYMEVGKN